MKCVRFLSGDGWRQSTPLAFPRRVLYNFQPIGFRDQLWPCSEIRTSKRQLSDEWLVKALSMSTPALAAGSVTSSFRWSTAWDNDKSLKRHAFKSHHYFRRGVKTASRSKQQISSEANQPESINVEGHNDLWNPRYLSVAITDHTSTN